MSAYWRVKTYCILVGVHEDWKVVEVTISKTWKQIEKYCISLT
jgi:hypothetical protein